MAAALLFGYFAIPGLAEADSVSLFISRTSPLAIPVVVAMLWQRTVTTALPTRAALEPVV